MDKVKFFEDRKFMWDASIYDTKDKAEEILNNYEKDGFETQLVEDDGKYLVYTRRVVKEVKDEKISAY